MPWLRFDVMRRRSLATVTMGRNSGDASIHVGRLESLRRFTAEKNRCVDSRRRTRIAASIQGTPPLQTAPNFFTRNLPSKVSGKTSSSHASAMPT